MAELSISIDTRKAQAVLEQLGPAAVQRRSHAAMNESLSYLQRLVQEAMPVNTGAARGSVATEIRGTPVDMLGRVFSPLEYISVLEEGRRPGARQPPTAPIRRWLELHGKSGSLAFVVARAIGRRGLPAHRMFATALEKGRDAVQRIWARHFSI